MRYRCHPVWRRACCFTLQVIRDCERQRQAGHGVGEHDGRAGTSRPDRATRRGCPAALGEPVLGRYRRAPARVSMRCSGGATLRDRMRGARILSALTWSPYTPDAAAARRGTPAGASVRPRGRRAASSHPDSPGQFFPAFADRGACPSFPDYVLCCSRVNFYLGRTSAMDAVEGSLAWRHGGVCPGAID